MSTGFIIKPFSEFWMNCFLNSEISILTSREPSFKYAAYLNDYRYMVAETKTNSPKKVQFVMVAFMNVVSHKYLDPCFSFTPFLFPDKNSGLEKIKELVKQEKMIAVGVDLFYWIPNSFCYQKYHWDHYSVIIGMDEKRKVFYVLDDNLQGFNCFEVPEERFCQAFGSLSINPAAFILDIAPDLKKFELNLTEVLFFAEKLSQELRNFDAESLLNFNHPDIPSEVWFDLFVKYVYQVVSRQTANILLFQALYDQNQIRDSKFISEKKQQANALKMDWRNLEQMIVKYYRLSPDKLEPGQLYERCDDLFQRELEMWNQMLRL
ncbi:MAG TPA: hypothetical protein VHY08_21585 [Bacillota bacterium]|nr:hypothetical protein [Bacillota bacterium]